MENNIITGATVKGREQRLRERLKTYLAERRAVIAAITKLVDSGCLGVSSWAVAEDLGWTPHRAWLILSYARSDGYVTKTNCNCSWKLIERKPDA